MLTPEGREAERDLEDHNKNIKKETKEKNPSYYILATQKLH